MLTAGFVLAALGAALHVFIFYLESVAWTSERARRIFGIASVAEAERTKFFAFNQGFYNLFLAVMVFLGLLLYALGRADAGLALIFAGAGSMTAAGVALMFSGPGKIGTALKQLTLPLAGIVLMVIGLTL